MTFVEFFGKDAVENLCACLTRCPDRVILIGDKGKLMKRHAEVYARLFAKRGRQVEFICRSVNKNDLQNIVAVLTEIVQQYDDCAFDLTGGEDLYLVAMGIVYERLTEQGLAMHRFNISNNTILDCDQDGRTIFEGEAPALSVEENVRIYGGDIVGVSARGDACDRWQADGFAADIDAMWEICREDPKNWNVQLGVFAAAENLADQPSGCLTLSVAGLQAHMKRTGGRYALYPYIFDGLYRAGLLLSYECDDDLFSVTFKNESVKRCLTKAGQILEMKVFSEALTAREKDGSPTYTDAMTGVCIDWDGQLHDAWGEHDTENEIDVLLMHGMVPVFVSCKNGNVETEELYKLNTVATRFGGKYAKKVLIAAELGANGRALLQRAKDMNIRVIDTIHSMSQEELQKAIRSLWRN